MSESPDHLAARLRQAESPDRRLDSEVTALALAPPRARLDDLAGIDGWDIVLPAPRGQEADVWLAADEVLYATQFVDAAIELCDQAMPATAERIVQRALAQVARSGGLTASTAAEIGGALARHILAELVDELSEATAPRRARVA